MNRPTMIEKMKRGVRAARALQIKGSAGDHTAELSEALEWLNRQEVSRQFDIVTFQDREGMWVHRLRCGVLGFGPTEPLVTIRA